MFFLLKFEIIEIPNKISDFRYFMLSNIRITKDLKFLINFNMLNKISNFLKDFKFPERFNIFCKV